MKLKKFALRGLITLAVMVALCMFFARTVQTITTPKVQLVTASNGRFEQEMAFQAEVHFPETEEITVKQAKELNVKVKRVYVKPGHYVRAGETIFTAEAPTSEEEMTKLRDEYDKKARELIDLDIANRKLSKESRQNELYNAMLDAQSALNDSVYKTRFLAMEKGVNLSGDVSMWKKLLSLAGDVPAEVTAAVDKTLVARSTYEAASSAYYEILENRKLRVKEEVFKYINDRAALMKTMDELTEKMVALNVSMTQLAEVKAERDGYIVSVGVAEGEMYDGLKPAYVMNAKDTIPVLRAPLAGVTRTVEDETKAEISSDSYGKEKTTVEKTVVAADGTKYLYIRLPESMLGENSSAVRRFMSDGGVGVNITYRAKKSTTLLPPSAVRNEGENNDYIYLVERRWGGFMDAGSMKVVKTRVTVLERGDKAVSIAEDFSYQQIADREDRALTDGQNVMEYVQ